MATPTGGWPALIGLEDVAEAWAVYDDAPQPFIPSDAFECAFSIRHPTDAGGQPDNQLQEWR
jgi:hypothetical protein